MLIKLYIQEYGHPCLSSILGTSTDGLSNNSKSQLSLGNYAIGFKSSKPNSLSRFVIIYILILKILIFSFFSRKGTRPLTYPVSDRKLSFCHSYAEPVLDLIGDGNPDDSLLNYCKNWIPAFAGMTKAVKSQKLKDLRSDNI